MNAWAPPMHPDSPGFAGYEASRGRGPSPSYYLGEDVHVHSDVGGESPHFPPQPTGQMNMQQRIAQKLLTAQTPRGSGESCVHDTGNRRHDRDARTCNPGIPGVPDQPPAPLPPWEENASIPDDLPVSKLHRAIHPSLNFPSFPFVHDDAVAQGATQPPTPEISPKNVSFLARDEVYQWDEKLEILKNVDEEFFELAHFLIDELGASSMSEGDYLRLHMASLEEDHAEKEEEDSGGLFSKLFGCSHGGEVGQIGMEKNVNQFKKYRLTEKLVNDFFSAVKYRMKNIESSREDGEDETDVTKRTKEIARKINAYGLPLLPSSAKIEIASNGEEAEHRDGEDEEDDEDGELSLDSFGRGRKQCFFPVLPTPSDEDTVDQGKEIDHIFTNWHNNSLDTKEFSSMALADSPPSSLKIPTPTSVFSSLLSCKTSMTNEEDCRKRICHLRHEIGKLQRMVDDTHNAAVKLDCHKRMLKLKEERRFFRIVQERYKIQAMLETAETGSIRTACRERLKQLVLELETIQPEKEDESAVASNKATNEEDSQWFARLLKYIGDDKKLTSEEDSHWYERLLQYVGNVEKPSGEEGSQKCTEKESQWYDRILKYIDADDLPAGRAIRSPCTPHAQTEQSLLESEDQENSLKYSGCLRTEQGMPGVHASEQTIPSVKQGNRFLESQYIPYSRSVLIQKSDRRPLQSNVQNSMKQQIGSAAVASAVMSSRPWCEIG